MIDVHTHILHDMDDGPATLEESINLIKKIAETGVDAVAATSHFYPIVESKESYVSKRNVRLAELSKRLDEESINVKVIPGAEVLLSDFLLNQSSLRDVCYNEGRYILIELPKKYCDFDETVLLLEKVISYYNVIPVIAHAERYKCLVKDIKNIKYLKDMGCLIQIDSDCFIDCFAQRHFVFHLLRNNLVDVIGSDCHDAVKRSSNLSLAYKTIADKRGTDIVEALKLNAKVIVGI